VNLPVLEFRPGAANDGEQLLSIHRRAIRELAKDFYSDELLASWEYGLVAEGYGIVMMEGEHFEVATQPDGKILGFCSTKDAEIKGLFVDPDFARRGLASLLFTRAAVRLREAQGNITLHLTASLSAVDFYRYHGWQETRRWLQPARGGLPMWVVDMELPFAA